MRRGLMEFYVGLFMLIGIMGFFILAIKVSGLTVWTNSEGYYVSAEFDNVGSLKVRAPVSIAGVRIGEVTNITLDPITFKARVAMRLHDDQKQIPNDTSASILTEGLLGSNYISLSPGYEEKFLSQGSRIKETHEAVILENLIGKLLFSIKGNTGNNKQ